MPHSRFIAALAVAALALAACSDDKDESSTTNPPATNAPSTDAPSTQPPAGGDLTVNVTNFAFSIPGPATAGATITIVNDDPFNHTFSDAGGAFNVPLGSGATATLTVDEPGSYNIICQIHSQMQATLVVN